MQGDRELQLRLREIFGSSVTIREKRGVGGGCINQTSVLVLDNGQRVFLKENSARYRDLFRTEALGLEALSAQGAPPVPKPYAHWESGGRQYLLLEYVNGGSHGRDFWEVFGRRLAQLHKSRRNPRFGFDVDNYIGANPQVNQWEESWPLFFGRHRLGYQLKLARTRGYASERWGRGLDRLIERLDELLPHTGDASLLHGDLWGGNYMVGADGHAVLIDPAVYYGDREADLAMTELFGGFGRRFYDAYDEAYPLEPGYSERKDLFNLYHLLNHLNLFGGSYASSVASIVSRYQ